MRKTSISGLVIAALLHLPQAVASELVTDRPDQTESAVTVPRDSWQIETGILLTRDREGQRRLDERTVLATLARYGLSERTELRLGFDGWVEQELDTGRRRFRNEGFGDASLGVKLLLHEESEGLPQMAFLATTTVPVGQDEVSSDRFDTTLRLALARTVTPTLSVGGNVGVEFGGEGETGFYTVVAGFPAGEDGTAFLEVFGDSEGSHSVDTGYVYLLRPLLQVDIAAGIGISDEAPDWFVGIGLSARFQ